MGKYILIDSGIDLHNKEIVNKVIDGVSILNNNEENISEKFQDYNGHGTYCFSTIQSIHPKGRTFVIKVTDENGKGSSKNLIKALEYTKKLDIRVICLSMATIKNTYKDDLEKICKELKNQGKIIVASLHNEYNKSYPAVFDSVIGIEGWDFRGDNNIFYLESKNDIQGKFDGVPSFAMELNNRYGLFKGNSKANAVAVGHILNILEENQNMNYEEILNSLESKSSNIEKNNLKNINIFNQTDDIEDINIFNKIYDILCMTVNKKLNKGELMSQVLLTPNIGLDFNSIYDFMRNIEDRFNIKFNFEKVNGYNVSTIPSLIKLVKENIEYENNC